MFQTKIHCPGIETGPPAWQARILPLNQQCSRTKVLEKIYKSKLLKLNEFAIKHKNFTQDLKCFIK